jgi:hypothetical protein
MNAVMNHTLPNPVAARNSSISASVPTSVAALSSLGNQPIVLELLKELSKVQVNAIIRQFYHSCITHSLPFPGGSQLGKNETRGNFVDFERNWTIIAIEIHKSIIIPSATSFSTYLSRTFVHHPPVQQAIDNANDRNARSLREYQGR